MTSSAWVVLGRPCDPSMLRSSPAVVPLGLRLRRTVGSRILSSLPSCDSSYRAWTFTPVGLAPTDHASFAGRANPPTWTRALAMTRQLSSQAEGLLDSRPGETKRARRRVNFPGSRIAVGVVQTSRV